MCPHCRTENHLVVYSRWVADVPGRTLTGGRVRLPSPAHLVGLLACGACGWYLIGHLEDASLDGGLLTGGHFVPDAPAVAP